MKTILLAALAAIPSLGLAVDPVQPGPMGVLAVAEPPGPSPELADLTRALNGAVAERTKSVLSAEDLRRRMAGPGAGASLSELDRAYSGAVAAYQRGDYEGASRSLRAVIDDLERMPESEDVYAQWTRAMLRLARAEGSLGRKGEAREVLERLVRANPSIKADPELYPPSFARQIEEVRAAQKAGPKRKLVVDAGGRPARVFVDGRDVGPAPYTASLPPGRYRVSGVVGEVRVAGLTTDLSAEDQTVRLDFSVVETFRPAAGPGLAVPAAQRSKTVVTAGATLNLDSVLSATIDAQGDVRYLVGALYDVRRGMLLREGRLRLSGATPPAGGLGALAGFLITGEPSALVISKPDLSVKPPKAAGVAIQASGAPSKPKVMGWSAIGAGGLAIGLAAFATYEGFSASGAYDDASAMKNPDGTLKPAYSREQYDSKVSDGDSARNVAYLSAGGAAAAAVTSGILGYLSYKQTGEIGPFRF
jgi:tetratricopeptide (TPR) repeat protein